MAGAKASKKPAVKKPVAKKGRKKAAKKSAPKKAEVPGEVVGEINGFPIRRLQAGVVTGADYNPRTITTEALEGLKRSREEFGLVQAIVWNRRTGHVVGGHQRLKTLDPSDFTDVVEVDLSEEREKALNLTLNNAHITGEFTSALGDLLAEIEESLPELASDIHLNELYVDVPTDMDDLLAESDTGESTGQEVKDEPAMKTNHDKAENWESSDLRQIVIILTSKEHEEVTPTLNKIMKKEDLESFSAAVLWLLRNYES